MANVKLWRIFIFDLSTGSIIGEMVDFRDIRMSFALSRNPTLGLQTGYGHWLTEEIIGDELYRGILAYRWNGTEYKLQFSGPIIATEENATGQDPTVSISAVGAGWRLSKRIANNQSNGGRSEAGLSFPETDRGLLAAQLIQTTNAQDGNSWIIANNNDQTAGSKIKIDKEEPYQSVQQLIDKLSTSLDGFDWQILPAFEFDNNNNLILGKFVSAPIIGTDKSNQVAFDYGCGRYNTASINRKKSIESIITKAIYPSAGASPYTVSDRADEQIARLGVFEEAITGDLTDRALRIKMLQLHVALRKNQRVLYEFQPFKTDSNSLVPAPFVDYNIGDRIGAQAAWSGKKRLEASMRVYGIEITINQTGDEQASLDLYIS